MARGDVKIWEGWGLSSNGSSSTLRPALGVSICITSASGSAGMHIGTRSDLSGAGGNAYRHIPIGNTTTTYSTGETTNMKVFATNSSYPAVISSTAGTKTFYASGIITQA